MKKLNDVYLHDAIIEKVSRRGDTTVVRLDMKTNTTVTGADNHRLLLKFSGGMALNQYKFFEIGYEILDHEVVTSDEIGDDVKVATFLVQDQEGGSSKKVSIQFEKCDVYPSNAKQVIIIRRDLGMRRGKEIAQGAHASMKFIAKALSVGNTPERAINLTPPQLAWFEGKFTKVTLQVGSEEELLEYKKRAEEAGLTVELVQDVGKTEFGGVQTNTALGIGPNWSDDIDEVTGDLKLY